MGVNGATQRQRCHLEAHNTKCESPFASIDTLYERGIFLHLMDEE